MGENLKAQLNIQFILGVSKQKKAFILIWIEKPLPRQHTAEEYNCSLCGIGDLSVEVCHVPADSVSNQ